MKQFVLLFCYLFSFANIHAQCGGVPIHHWESCVLENTTWKYRVPTASIPGWELPTFNDAAWTSGIGGIGFGDGDDNTVIATSSRSVYMRKSFTIIDTSQIKSAVLCMDYDDGFVAFLNGKEIARSNMNASQQWNSFATATHEALMYQGQNPEYFQISQQALDTLLVNGTNVLCIQTHNNVATSPDLTSRPFLQLSILNASTFYSPVPSWFVAPVTLLTNLPIMKIETNGQTIIDDPRIICDMGIIDNGVGVLNCITDPANNYNGKISIEFRGSTSQNFPKKPYGFSTVNGAGASINVSLLGMPEENDWILLNPYTDKTFMRDALIYDIARSMNRYASRARFLELVINGEYKGVYVLLEKIKRDDNRVNIGKLTTTANSGDSLTGGYIIKIDKQTGSSNGGWSSTQGITIQNHVPKWDEITSQQQNYIENYINTFENSLFGGAYTDPNNGYRKFANVYSFADFFIQNEISNNIDGYRLSSFAHKDRNSKCGKFTMGPLWDFNLSFGNADYCNGYYYQGWQLYTGCGLDGTGYWVDRMLQDQWFKNIVRCRWNELRTSTLSTASLLARIDTNANYLRQASSRDSTVWQTIGNYVWPNGWVANTWQGEIDSMKWWLANRLSWMDANMYGTTVACNANAGLSVIIDEINFHSDSTIDAGDWLEIWNTGSTPVNLSNAVLLDGNTLENYCIIPNNTILAANDRLVIYEDALKFNAMFPGVTNKIGPLCFKLNNGGQTIILRDKDNKLITTVSFQDTWQCSADGNGRTLQLLTPTSIPNNAASWFAACIGGSPGVAYTPCADKIICSEINYNSALTADAGDWVELFNKGTSTINLGGWTLRDGSQANVFTFPNPSLLAANQYVTLFSEAAKFNAQFPSVLNKIGPLGFNFSSSGDVLRLYDNLGKLQYSMCYSSVSPWPSAANGGGKTLENGQYNGNPNASTSWFAGCPKGSPGEAYNPSCFVVGVQEIAKEQKISVYPNPAADKVTITSTIKLEEIEVLDVIGKRVAIFNGNTSEIDIRFLQTGLYMIKCTSGKTTQIVKLFKK